MKYRTNNLDAISRKKISLHTLTEIMLQDAFLTNYKIALGIIDGLETTNEDDNKQLYARCLIAIKHQVKVTEEGVPIFEDYAPVYARVVRLGNNWKNINTQIIEKQLCLLLFTDRPFDNAWTQESIEADPTTQPLAAYRAHNMGDALCIPIANDVALCDETTVNDNLTVTKDLTVKGDLTVGGNLTVTGNITAAHIEAEDGFTGTKTWDGGSAEFKGGVCIQ